jgi:hypothetical protein
MQFIGGLILYPDPERVWKRKPFFRKGIDHKVKARISPGLSIENSNGT